MKRILIPTRSGADWQRLLAKPGLHWQPGRSAMTAAAAWEAARDRLPDEIAKALNASGEADLAGLQLVAAIPEWEVPLPGGTRSSFTDVMAIARNEKGLGVLAVEAKAGESFGPTLSEWQAEGSDGKSERLKFLQGLLGCSFAGATRYQLMHRCASAILAARQLHATTAVMLVHAWKSSHDQRQDVASFCEAMGATRLAASVWRVERFESPRLYLAWCEGDVRHLDARLPSNATADDLLAALEFAAVKHRMQRRKDAEASPYINHPIALARLLAEVGVEDKAVLQAAILHDTIEDTATSYEEVEERFGRQVADVVAEVTDDKNLQKEERKQLQIHKAPHVSVAAAHVKLADKICNLRDLAAAAPPDWSLERRREYFDWAKRVVDGLPKVNSALHEHFVEAMKARP